MVASSGGKAFTKMAAERFSVTVLSLQILWVDNQADQVVEPRRDRAGAIRTQATWFPYAFEPTI